MVYLKGNCKLAEKHINACSSRSSNDLVTNTAFGSQSELSCLRWKWNFWQGQRTLICYCAEGLDEEFVVPATATAFHDQTVFARVLLQQG